jgi:hypothetical protein
MWKPALGDSPLQVSEQRMPGPSCVGTGQFVLQPIQGGQSVTVMFVTKFIGQPREAIHGQQMTTILA